MFAKEFSADRYRHLIAGRWFDALLPDEAVGKASHRSRWWIRCCAMAPCAAKQRKSPRGSTLLQLTDNALSDIAYGVNRADSSPVYLQRHRRAGIQVAPLHPDRLAPDRLV